MDIFVHSYSLHPARCSCPNVSQLALASATLASAQTGNDLHQRCGDVEVVEDGRRSITPWKTYLLNAQSGLQYKINSLWNFLTRLDKLINDIMSRKLLVPRLFSFTKTGSCRWDCSISRAGMWTLDRLRFRLGSHACECAGVSALTVRTYSVKANIQTEKKVRRGISGQPVLILNHQHRGQNQSRCDSITNEGQITGM